MRINRFLLFRFFLTILIVFGFSFNTASAQNVQTHYGPRPAVGVFSEDLYRAPNVRGKYYFPLGIDRSTESTFFGVIVDPAYEAKMKKDRSITSDLPLTPIYDLIVQIRPTWEGFYDPEEILAGRPTEPPDELPYKAYIKVGDEKILGPGIFKKGGKLTDRNYNEFDVYEWKISGNDLKGIVGGEKMEKLVAAIQNAGQPGVPEVKVSVEFPDIYNGPQAPEEIDPGFSLCAPIRGSGEKKIIPMRNNTNSANISTFISKANSVMNEAFAKTDPWKTYFDKLSFYIDLGKHNVNDSLSLGDIGKISSCGSNGFLYLIFGDGAGSGFDGHVSEIPYFSSEPDYLELSLHESGHAVGNLWDESQCGVTLGMAKFKHKSISETDCTKTNSNFRYNNIWYGGKDIGYDELADNNKDVKAHWFIPNLKNLMRYPPDNTKYYNVISCGFIVAAIVDQPVGDSGYTNVDYAHAQKHWPAIDSSGPNSKGCYAMDTAKTDIPPLNLNTPTITKINE